MKTCLGSLLLIPTIAAVVATVVYHMSVNSELQFEQRDTNTEFINTNRSYRPPTKRNSPKTRTSEREQIKTLQLQDDDTAEEV